MYLSLATLLIYLALVFLILGTLGWGCILAAPWVPIRSRDVNRLLKLAELTPNSLLCDLGSGDGRLIIQAAQQYKAKTIGYEVAVLPFLYSYFKIILKGLGPKAKVKYGNFYKKNLGGADVITAFLSPRAMLKLREKFEKEAKKGCLILSYSFRIPGWAPYKVDRPSQKDLPIFIYKI